MAMEKSALAALLAAAFPDGEVIVTALADDGDHYAAKIVSSTFKGMSRVQQHRLVHDALKGKLGGELHALQLTTVARD
jgi:stress-induced morphogen